MRSTKWISPEMTGNGAFQQQTDNVLCLFKAEHYLFEITEAVVVSLYKEFIFSSSMCPQSAAANGSVIILGILEGD